jgi:hypothetical protein
LSARLEAENLSLLRSGLIVRSNGVAGVVFVIVRDFTVLCAAAAPKMEEKITVAAIHVRADVNTMLIYLT